MKIIVLIGTTASGKDTIVRELLKRNNKLKKIVSATNRPMREGEIHCKDYNFVTDKEMKTLINENKLIETREYDTKNGVWTYGTLKESIDINSNDTYIHIVDWNGLEAILDYIWYALGGVEGKEINFDDYIKGYYIDADVNIRLERYKKRNNDTYEMCRRILADKEQIEDVYEDLYKDDINKLENNNKEDFEIAINKILEDLKKWNHCV